MSFSVLRGNTFGALASIAITRIYGLVQFLLTNNSEQKLSDQNYHDFNSMLHKIVLLLFGDNNVKIARHDFNSMLHKIVSIKVISYTHIS